MLHISRRRTLGNMLRTAAAVATALLIAGVLSPNPARAAWPDRPITLIVHFAPGGASDLLGRIMAAELTTALGQTVVVENRPGANGNIGLTAVSRAAPDGYTLVVASGVVLINPSVSKVAYDPIKDFTPIAFLGAGPNVVVTSPKTGISSIEDLIAKAKAKPGTINFASPGVGSVSQLVVELIKLRAGIDLMHVPYSGANPALQAAISGTTELASVGISGLLGHIQAGSVKALAQSGRERWPELPDVPTLEDAGIKNADIDTTQMLMGPAGLPKEIVDRLAVETEKILKKPELREKMFKAAFGLKFEGPDALRARIAREVPMWREIVERAGIKTN
jgi:tripartite-type tricarboxylate transporter receptor subunit TctC